MINPYDPNQEANKVDFGGYGAIECNGAFVTYESYAGTLQADVDTGCYIKLTSECEVLETEDRYIVLFGNGSGGEYPKKYSRIQKYYSGSEGDA
jgi:hypothetical protein